MSDAPKWETVIPSTYDRKVLSRCRVPGGWLYRVYHDDGVSNLAFVPDVAIQRKEWAIYQRALRAELKELAAKFPPPENV